MKIVYLAPHLSCGGCPQVILKRIQALMLYVDNVEIYLIEHNDYGKYFPTQRNQIIDILEDRFYSLDKNKMEAMDIINDINPDIIHIDEMSERLDRGLITALYNNNRTYRIIETCHDISFDPNSKIFQPDLFLFCTPYHEETFADLDSQYYTIQYPIDFKTISTKDKERAKVWLDMDVNKKHILNVGIWTKGKNQSEGLDIARQYPDCMFHFVGAMASNFSEYWEPLMKDIPDNVKIWGERSDVEDFMTAADVFMFNSTWECNPLVIREALSHALPIMARNLPQYGDMFQKYLDPIHSDPRTLSRKYKFVNSTNSRVYALEHEKAYDAILKFPIRKQSVVITQNYISQPFLEIKGISDSDFKVQFLDEKGSIAYENTIKANSWVKLNRQYYTRYTAKVFQDGELIYSNTLNLEGKRVFISIDSKALGDTLAWIGYCLEFKKKHNCEVVVSTFWNKILDYPELELVEPGHVTGCYALYNLGWHWDADKEPVLCNTIPLQQSASNILGLDYYEVKPRLKYDASENKYGKYVTIATNSTAGLKFWLRSHWEQVINYLTERGYKVINTSKESNPFNNCYQLEDATIENTMSVIHHSQFFIGLSSGLSHLAWGLGKQVVMIAGFSEPDHEFSCHRPYNHKVCHGCWNDPAIKFDAGDYLFCPHHKNTNRMFECQNSITPEMVINLINEKMHNL
jgi:autotransporter strand-loop-strand O-heptosyltransferase